MKYIFVTGGVVSSLGKGLAAASIGTLLERCGLKVTLQKFDPYLNVDPGTMSPFHIMINYFEELMSEEYRSYLKYETLMEDEELASMFDIPELSPEEEAVVQLINEILDRFDNETQVDRTTAFKAAIRYLMEQDEDEAMNLEKIAATLTVLLENVLDEEKNVEEQES